MRQLAFWLMIILTTPLANCRSAVQGPTISPLTYDGPLVRLEVVQQASSPPCSIAEVRITVPTGGWQLTFDQSPIEGGVAKLFLTLQRPGPDDIVTQAIQTLTKSCVSADPPFTKAEAYIHLVPREGASGVVDYRLAATAP